MAINVFLLSSPLHLFTQRRLTSYFLLPPGTINTKAVNVLRTYLHHRVTSERSISYLLPFRMPRRRRRLISRVVLCDTLSAREPEAQGHTNKGGKFKRGPAVCLATTAQHAASRDGLLFSDKRRSEILRGLVLFYQESYGNKVWWCRGSSSGQSFIL